MNADEFPVGIAVRAIDAGGQPTSPTAIELSAALTFVHRTLNLAAEHLSRYTSIPSDVRASQWSEPSLLNVEVRSVSNGSVIIAAILTIASDPFAQGVGGGILANVITPALLTAAERLKLAFRRAGPASAGRQLEVDVDVPGRSVQVRVRYTQDGRTRVTVKAK